MSFRVSVVIAFLWGLDGQAEVWSPVSSAPSVRRLGSPDHGTGWIRLAPTDSGYLAVWEDLRTSSTNARIVAARFSSNRVLMDTAGFFVADSDDAYQWDPNAACGPSFCIITWRSGDTRVLMRTYNPVTSQFGPILQVNDASSAINRLPLIAWVNGGSMIVWAGAGDVFARQLDSTGMPISGVLTLPRVLNGDGPEEVSMAASVGRYAVSFRQYNPASAQAEVVLTTIAHGTSTFSALQTVGPSCSQDPCQTELFHHSSQFIVSWVGPSLRNIHFRRYSHTGNPSGAPVSLAVSETRQAPVLSFNNSVFVAFRPVRNTILAQALSATDLSPLNAETVVLTSNTPFGGGVLSRFRVSVIQTTGLMMWHAEQRGFENNADVGETANFSMTAAGDVTVVSPAAGHFRFGVTADAHVAPTAAWTGSGFVAAWASSLNQQSEFSAVDLDAAGLPRRGVSVALGSVARPRLRATLSPQPGGVDAVWAGIDGVWWRPLSATATPLAAAQFLGTTPASSASPVVTEIQGRRWVLWCGGGSLYAHEVGSTAPIGTVVQVAAAPDCTFLAAAGPGVVWVHLSNISGLRLSASGSVISGSERLLLADRTFGGPVALATNGTESLVAFRSQDGNRVEACLLSATGDVVPASCSVLHTNATVTGLGSRTWPAAVWDGTTYVVAWHAWVSRSEGVDVQYRRVSATGVLGPRGTVAGGPENQGQPALSTDGQGRTLFSFLEYDTTAGSLRTRFRTLAHVGPGGFCTASADCQSGLCAAGRCESSDGGFDGGMPDAGVVDSGAFDAGVAGSGSHDAGLDDGGVSVPDDGGPSSATDAGRLDGVDAGVAVGPTPSMRLSVACGCSQTSVPWWGGMAVLLFARRKRT
jgi:hypothetical protein